MIRELQLSTFAKSAALSALGLLASVSSMAYPGAPAKDVDTLKIVSSCLLQDRIGTYLLGFTEDISGKLAAGQPCPDQGYAIMLTDKFQTHKTHEDARANGNETVFYYDRSDYSYYTKQYGITYKNGSYSLSAPLAENSQYRSWNALLTATTHFPAIVEVEKVSRTFSEIKPTIKEDTQKSIELTSACKQGQKIFGYTASVPRDNLATDCPDGWQIALTVEDVTATRENFQYTIRDDPYSGPKFYRTQNLAIIRSKFGNELFRVEPRRQAMAEMMLAMTTTSTKHPVLLTVDLERKLILDLRAQANPREF